MSILPNTSLSQNTPLSQTEIIDSAINPNPLIYATLYISPSYENIWGKSCQSLYDDSYSFIRSIHPEYLPIILDSYRQIRLGNSTSNEYRIVRPDGKIRWIYERAFPIKNSRGKVDCVSKLAEDISDSKRAEIELIRVKEQLALVLKSPRNG